MAWQGFVFYEFIIGVGAAERGEEGRDSVDRQKSLLDTRFDNMEEPRVEIVSRAEQGGYCVASSSLCYITGCRKGTEGGGVRLFFFLSFFSRADG